MVTTDFRLNAAALTQNASSVIQKILRSSTEFSWQLEVA
jgi:hypothetical protein